MNSYHRSFRIASSMALSLFYFSYNMYYLSRFYLLLSFTIVTHKGLAQNGNDTCAFKIVIAGHEYKKLKIYQTLWGRNRRVEWTTPVHVRVLWLDSVQGGLTPYKSGGGNETKSLRLQTSDGKQYSLRSVNKSREDVILPVFRNTFIGDIIKDGISMSYPYGALAVYVMEQNAGIYYTIPEIVYLPAQPGLDTFNQKFGDDLYLFEQRPEGDWSDATNLGNFKSFSSTHEVVTKLKEDNTAKADQNAFVKARLFDMLISDWDRHEDNWKWGLTDTFGKLIYKPVPRDRDQAFYTHNGLLINLILPVAGLGFMQNFDYTAKHINILNAEAKNLDRFFTNEMSLDHWVNAAISLKQALTDSVIERSIQQLPQEIFAVSGNELISKLKSRREHLVSYATEYYLFLAKKVNVTGSKEREYFEVKRSETGKTFIKVFRIKEEGQREDTAFYTRIFTPEETKEIRLYGIAGEDIYTIEGNAKGVKICIIGGSDKDSVIQHTGSSRIHIYDDDNNVFQITSAKLHLSSASAKHAYKYEGYNNNKKD